MINNKPTKKIGLIIKSGTFLDFLGLKTFGETVGWRIDYFLVSPSLKEKLQDAKIHGEIMGSDHCPVELDIDL